jgi:hypothetical protein
MAISRALGELVNAKALTSQRIEGDLLGYAIGHMIIFQNVTSHFPCTIPTLCVKLFFVWPKIKLLY